MKRLITVAVLACAFVLSAEASAAGPLTGQYQTVISGKAAVLNGTWVMRIAPNGFYTVAKKPNLSKVLVGGSTAISGKRVMFSDLQGPLACKGMAAYTFSLAGRTVRFTKVKDSCAGRLALLGAKWTKLP